MPSLPVLKLPIFSPFSLLIENTTFASGAPVSESVLMILIPESGLLLNVTVVGTLVFTSTVFGVSSRI